MAKTRNPKSARGHEPEPNRDPITDEPGAHPVGVAGGALGAGVAGAAVGGAVGGPVGAVVGAVAGSVAGGAAGHAIAEQLHPTDNETYWRAHFHERPYVDPDATYADFGPAYQYGWEAAQEHRAAGRSFEEVEADLRRDWPRRCGASTLTWDTARHAAQDAWERTKPVQ